MTQQIKDILTTGEVGALLKVTVNTVAIWFDAGFIKGFTNPGSNTRRISKEDLLKFVRAHDIPLKRLQKEPFLTTAQCAKFCFVTVNTITKWIDRGMLPGFNLGTERRLVFYRDLVRFMKDNKIPLTKVKEYAPKQQKEGGRRTSKKRLKRKNKRKDKPRKGKSKKTR